MRQTNRLIPALLVGLATLSLGCSGGGSGDESGSFASNGGSAINVSGSFAPSVQNPGNNTVYMTGNAGSGGNASVMTIPVWVKDTTDIFGASFDVTFEPAMVQYVSWNPGQVLEFGNQTVAYQVFSATPGRITVGMARTSNPIGVTVTTPKPLIEIVLQVTAAGTSTVGFENADLLDSQNPPQNKPGVAFFGGDLTAN